MRLVKIITVLFIIFSTTIFAQNSERKFIRVKLNNNGSTTIIVNDGTYIITPYNSKIIETTFIPTGEIYNPKSHAVIMTPNESPQFIDSENTIQINTSEISATIQKSPFQISYSYKGKRLSSNYDSILFK